MNKELVQINQAKTALTEARDLDDMEFHEIADIFPMMIGDDYRALRDDIAKEGLKLPLVLYEGKILDGRNRYIACLELGIDCTTTDYQGDTPVSEVMSMNMHRRQLSSSQRAVIALEVLPELEAEAKKRMVAGKADPMTILSQGTARDQAAKLVDTSPSYVSDAKNIQAKAPELIDNIKSGDLTIPKAKKEIRARETEQRKAELIQAAADVIHSDRYELLHGDVADMMRTLDEASIDVIVSDPPYPREYIPLYGKMAAEAKRVLKPGGLCVLMVGQSYLPDLFDQIKEHLVYHWTAFYHVPGARNQLFHRKIFSTAKPLIIFTNGDYTGGWIQDVCISKERDKSLHEWGQSESGMQDIVEKYTSLNDLVLDPFCGAGTTGVVALRLGRRFIGIDNDLDTIGLAKGRIENDTKEA